MAPKGIKTLVLSLLTGLASPNFAMAQQTTEDKWQFSGNVYLWGAGIEGTTVNGTEASVSFGDLVSNLDFALMGGLEARRGKWLVLSDVLYLDVYGGKSSSRPVLPGLPGGGFTVDGTAAVGVKGTVFQLAGGYQLVDNESISMHGIFGARYLKLEADIGLNLTTPLGGRSVNLHRDGDSWDAIVGGRGRAKIDKNWFVPFYADIGTGNSDLTWQVFTGIGYNFGRSDLVLGYRHIAWDFNDGSILSEIAFSGPDIQYIYRF